MFCRKCGKTVPNDSKFCPYCGESVAIEAEETPKEHGFCKSCGSPLPDGKIFGLCDNCLNRSGVEASEYGGDPLEPEDDNQNYAYGADPEIKRPKKHGGAIVAILAVVIIACVGTYYSRLDSPTDAVSSEVVSSAASSAVSSAADAVVEPPTAPAVTEPEPDLELISSNGMFDTAINAIHITGSIQNNSGVTYSYVQVQFYLYDKSGAQVGTALANVNGLEPGKTWKYDAIGMAPNIAEFKLMDLSGY